MSSHWSYRFDPTSLWGLLVFGHMIYRLSTFSRSAILYYAFSAEPPIDSAGFDPSEGCLAGKFLWTSLYIFSRRDSILLHAVSTLETLLSMVMSETVDWVSASYLADVLVLIGLGFGLVPKVDTESVSRRGTNLAETCVDRGRSVLSSLLLVRSKKSIPLSSSRTLSNS